MYSIYYALHFPRFLIPREERGKKRNSSRGTRKKMKFLVEERGNFEEFLNLKLALNLSKSYGLFGL